MSQDPIQASGATAKLREEIQAAVGNAYTVERQIAAGASARLFLATDTALGRRVVLKVMPPGLSATIDMARFRREIRLVARLTHPNIVPLLSAGEARGIVYFTMPFVEGESLYDGLARDGELPITEVVSILRDVAKALAYAHAHGVVHRDLKPDNVLLTGGSPHDRAGRTDDGRMATALLADFGIAKALTAASRPDEDRRTRWTAPDGAAAPLDRGMEDLTAAGIAVGTPAYVSPEQAAGDPRIDHRTDLYSLGVVAYEMLAGQPPFTHRATHAMLAAHRNEPPPPIASRREGTPRWLAQLVMRLLEKRPADRPQSGDEVVQVLDTAMTVSESSPARTGLARRGQGRALAAELARVIDVHRLSLGAGAGIAVILPLLIALGATPRRHTAPRPASGGAAVAPPTRAAASDAIAVLPFGTVGRDSVEQVFADGLADELTSALGALPGLRVASRTSVAALQAARLTAVAIADSLRVSRVLEGTVERSGEQLRITAQLTSAGDGLALWSVTYERPARDLFALQDEIAGDIARAITRGLAVPASGVH